MPKLIGITTTPLMVRPATIAMRLTYGKSYGILKFPLNKFTSSGVFLTMLYPSNLI
jgi:hypothetical protein